jgi:hypothetical protein
METARQCAKDAGAIIRCPICRGYDIQADDPEAEQNAYAMATNLWKDGSRGFRGMDRQDVMGAVKSAIVSANIECPSCSVETE